MAGKAGFGLRLSGFGFQASDFGFGKAGWLKPEARLPKPFPLHLSLRAPSPKAAPSGPYGLNPVDFKGPKPLPNSVESGTEAV
jgi:hypothetical protein